MSVLEKPGTYKARATSHEFGESQKKGTPYVSVTLEVTDGPEKGKSIRADLWMTENTEQRVAESLMHLGWNGKDFTKLPGLGTQVANVVCEMETYEGNTKLKVKWINSGDAPVMAMTEEKKQSFAERMEALAQATKDATSGPTAAKASDFDFK